mmetsp:Transcript_30471/g.37519  ORF Transcript_30471/g.37519 Transcript_30471/m.37519 type:complete len:112 (+) Transcript_30471:22-357(+)|eukprot:CAMPEP_0170458060 /NCGR_PEP_ID=MMETSP0123-20130129/5144_1 /TAXON_ID=182087 /ORGANISM="Favella ehrenbergii, Strain Fehren 1" /LENGTH=111 /DNA_ID=CAMNT_0010722059 /DNA_START=6 /DNA_END=341 /DNA_ORIENTATION=+
MSGKLLRNTDEIQGTLETLNVLLNDEETFHQVCLIVFQSIDEDNSGYLDSGEIRGFIDNICSEMDVERHPDDRTLEAAFLSMDEDGSNEISFDELCKFLRRVFILQRDEIA